jgi:hypothetical protein
METTSWWSELTDEQIDRLKNETKALMYTGAQKILRSIPKLDLEWLSKDGFWITPALCDLSNGLCYRLRHDWTKPEEKKCGWECCEVKPMSGVYHFEREGWGLKELSVAQSMVGYGDTEYKIPGEDRTVWLSRPPSFSSLDGPAIPTRVRFWKG